MLSSFWSCASLRSGGGGTWPIAPSCVRGGLLLVPPTPGHSVPGAQRGHGTPRPSPCSSQGGLSGNAWARVPRVRARGTEEGPPHSRPPAGGGRAEVASAPSCRDRAAVTLQMLRKVIAGPGEGDEEKGEKDGVRQEGRRSSAAQAGPGAERSEGVV